ncbi:MAG: translation initiation factor IF-2 [Deltaproteobacteria bacterium]|nr:translation initiation factor IF-2 [Deltaproteobacteria bacterium]
MAKIRVYELARKLNVSNKALIDKLEKLNISVKSHMSVIEDKDKIFEKIKGSESEEERVSETRVKSTIIRRRKKIIKTSDQKEIEQKKLSDTAVDIKPAADSGREDIDSQSNVEKKQEEDKKEDQKDKPRKIEKKKEEKPEAKPAQLARKQNKKKKKDRNIAAKIIKLPDKIEKSIEPIPVFDKKEEITDKPALQELKEVNMSEKGDKKQPFKTKDLKKNGGEKVGERKKAVASKKKGFKKEINFKWKEVIEGGALNADVIHGKKRKKSKKQKGQKTQITTPKASKRRIKTDETIVLSELGKRMGIKANELIVKLMSMGVMATINQTIDFETTALVASEFGFEAYKAVFEEESILEKVKDEPEKMLKRAPIVTIMGHIDHGKTSLLDAIRKTKVIDTEAGGITQHIGAYSVKTEKGEITFLDTPGHEAFTSMRARGAKVTDIVVLVVAADDGVMLQTMEAINHSKAANVPMIVAINKIDKPSADKERIVRELAEQGLISEEWGGDTIFVDVSAKKNIGIDNLLEMILLQAEMLELKANPDKQASGYVIEAKLDIGKGPVATVLVQEGTLKAGDVIVCGIHYGKVRALINDIGKQVNVAAPSIPVKVLGLSGVPTSGDQLISASDEKKAKQVSSYRTQKQRFVELAKTSRMSLDALFEKMQKGETKTLNLIVKADVQGSIEALKESLTQLSIDEVEINTIHSATGTITESDIFLAAVSNAIIVGFNVRPSGNTAAIAEEERVDIRYYNIIYEVINDIKSAILGMMKSTFKENVVGRAEVRKVFHVPKIGSIFGCYIIDGKIERNKNARVLRDGVILYDGSISSLKRYKDDVKEVLSGYECGIGIEKYNDIKENDIIESYFVEEIKPNMPL